MLLALSAWMRLMLGDGDGGSPDAPAAPGTLPPDAERVRRAVHAAVTAHPLHHELVQVHGMGGCQYFAFAGAMALEGLGFGRARVALGRVAFRAAAPNDGPQDGPPDGPDRWIGYPAARADLRLPDPAQRRERAEAFAFHAWIRLTTSDGRHLTIDFDLSNVLREVRLRAPSARLDFSRPAPAFWGTAADARAAGLRFEARRLLTAGALMPGDRRVFEAIARSARDSMTRSARETTMRNARESMTRGR